MESYMNVLDCVNSGIFYLDGGTGSYLQAMGLQPGELPELLDLSRPEAIVGLGKAYYEAGSHMICTNTFGANSLKFHGKDGMHTVEQVVYAAVNCAKKAREIAVGGQIHRYIALAILYHIPYFHNIACTHCDYYIASLSVFLHKCSNF